MNPKIMDAAMKVKKTTIKNSPQILIGLGIAGFFASTIVAVKATPKAIDILEEYKKENKIDKIKPIEAVKLTWKNYLPAVIFTLSSTGLVISGCRIQHKRTVAIAAACAMSEKAFKEYKESVFETVDAKTNEKIENRYATKTKETVDKPNVILAGSGSVLCFDSLSSRYFNSDMQSIKNAQIQFNQHIQSYDYENLNYLYSLLGLKETELGEGVGWHREDGLLEIGFESDITEDGNLCLVLTYTSNMPTHNYKKR